jgi:hypothetical protein
MIKPEDFKIEIGHTEEGTYVLVRHPWLGIDRLEKSVSPESVGATKERLVQEITREIFNPKDFQVQHMRGIDGDYIRVTHLPTGLLRQAKSPQTKRSREMMDEILEELHG